MMYGCSSCGRHGVALSIVCVVVLSHSASGQVPPSKAPPKTTESERSLDFDPFGSSDPAPASPSIRSPFEPLPSVTVPSQTILQLGNSTAGGPIASVPCDPYMSPEQEARILALLQLPDDTDWNGLSLQGLRTLLKNRVGVWLDRNAISNAGFEIEDGLPAAANVISGPLGDRLDCLFSDTDLCFTIRANRLEVTTDEALSRRANMRIYDVTPLVSKVQRGERSFDFDSLQNLIQQSVAADDWYSAGGRNVIIRFVTGTAGNERALMVVTAPYTVQMQLRTLLDRLNATAAQDQSSTKK